MTEDRAKQVLKAHGWIPRVRNVRRTYKFYLYAYRRRKKEQGGKMEERYIGKLEDLARLSEQDILAKLS